MPTPNKMAKKLPGLRRTREARNLSLRQLAGLSGQSYPNISRIENGQPATLATARRLAKVLRVPVEELIGYGSSRDGLLDMAGFVRSLGFEPEGHFTEVAFPSEEVHRLYEATYVRLLKAEKRASDERWDEPFDSGLGDYLMELAEVENGLPSGSAKEEIRERVGKLARRVSEVYAREAKRLENQAGVITLAVEKRRPQRAEKRATEDQAKSA